MQPDPVRNNNRPIVDVVLDDFSITGVLREAFKERKQLGADRYGTPLQPFNGRCAVQDAADEALDLVIYLTQCMVEYPDCAEYWNHYQAALVIAEDLVLRLRQAQP